jgi:hypothetical protein
MERPWLHILLAAAYVVLLYTLFVRAMRNGFPDKQDGTTSQEKVE